MYCDTVVVVVVCGRCFNGKVAGLLFQRCHSLNNRNLDANTSHEYVTQLIRDSIGYNLYMWAQVLQYVELGDFQALRLLSSRNENWLVETEKNEHILRKRKKTKWKRKKKWWELA